MVASALGAFLRPRVAPHTAPLEVVERIRAAVETGDAVTKLAYPSAELRPRSMWRRPIASEPQYAHRPRALGTPD